MKNSLVTSLLLPSICRGSESAVFNRYMDLFREKYLVEFRNIISSSLCESAVFKLEYGMYFVKNN